MLNIHWQLQFRNTVAVAFPSVLTSNVRCCQCGIASVVVTSKVKDCQQCGSGQHPSVHPFPTICCPAVVSRGTAMYKAKYCNVLQGADATGTNPAICDNYFARPAPDRPELPADIKMALCCSSTDLNMFITITTGVPQIKTYFSQISFCLETSFEILHFNLV